MHTVARADTGAFILCQALSPGTTSDLPSAHEQRMTNPSSSISYLEITCITDIHSNRRLKQLQHYMTALGKDGLI